MTAPLEAFGILDLRVGRVLRAEPNVNARKPSYKLWIDFGPLGTRQSSAQLVDLYQAGELVGRLVVAAVNLGARNVAGFTSEVLVLGLPDADGRVVLLAAERDLIRHHGIQLFIRWHAEIDPRLAAHRSRSMLGDGDEREVTQWRTVVAPAQALWWIRILPIAGEVSGEAWVWAS